MRKLKGFMHVVEMLLVILLVLFVFTQFASIPSISADWQKTKLTLMGNDILHTLEASGVDWFNRTEVVNSLNKTLPENIMYSVTIRNAIKPQIKIGCLCSDSELAAVNGMLSPGGFWLNGANTSFEVVKVGSAAELFSLDFDVALVYGYEAFTDPAVYAAMKNFLAYDRGIVEIADLPVMDNTQKAIFGLNSSAQRSDSSGIIFSASSAQNGRETNRIYDYFAHIPLFYDAFRDMSQWAGDAAVAATGNPPPSVRLTGSGCYTENTFIFTRFYDSFRNGEIDFDVYLANGASVFIGFGKEGGYTYLASLSSNRSVGYDSFYRSYPLQVLGSNTSHLTTPLAWHHVKIVAEMSRLTLYNDGEKVASSPATGLLPSNISISNKCGEAYVDNMRATEPELKELGNFLDNENTTQISSNQNKILLVQKGTALPACVINYNIEGIGKGRTVWLSNASAVSDDHKILVKALIAWAAGDEYKIVGADIKRPVAAYIYRSGGSEMPQTMKIILELGYLY